MRYVYSVKVKQVMNFFLKSLSSVQTMLSYIVTCSYSASRGNLFLYAILQGHHHSRAVFPWKPVVSITCYALRGLIISWFSLKVRLSTNSFKKRSD